MDECDGAFISRPRGYGHPLTELGERYQTFQPDDKQQEEGEGDHAYSYDMSRYPRGKLVIVNINKVTHSDSLTFERNGTQKDCDELKDVFLSFGFVVDIVEDVNKKELLRTMAYISQQNYQQTNALFIAFLTHGQEKFIFASDGQVELRKITNMFRGSNLAGKPKVFLIQACQGSEHMKDIMRDEVDGRFQRDIKIPVEADFLYAYSTVPGFSSWRNASGSWFIQILCRVFRKHGCSMDVVRMLTKVNNLLCERTSYTDDPLTNRKKQISSIVSQLRKELYLCPVQPNQVTSSV